LNFVARVIRRVLDVIFTTTEKPMFRIYYSLFLTASPHVDIHDEFKYAQNASSMEVCVPEIRNGTEYI